MRELWEFPGGKVENDESARAALRRELIEELGIIELETEHFLEAKHDYAEIRVSIEFFIVTAWKGTPTGKEGQRLRWVAVNELDAGLLLPADVAVVEALRELR